MTPFYFRCPDCGTRNRIPADKVGKSAKCGKCSAVMDTNELRIQAPVTVMDKDFSRLILKSPLPVLLDCWAPWCGPCQILGPVLTELAAAWQGKIRICKLNVDQNPETAARFHVRSVPTLLIFDKGQLQDSMAGALPKHQIMRKMAAYL